MATIYLVNIENLSYGWLQQQLQGKMPDTVLARSAQYKNEGDMLRNLAGEALSRYAISRTTGMFPDGAFHCNPQGKPYLDTQTYFNISHSGNYVVVGISPFEIGVDIEKLRRNKMKVARRFFSSEEIANIQQATNPDELFTTFWSLKEAYLKYTGTGLTKALNTFTVKLLQAGRYDVYSEGEHVTEVWMYHQVIDSSYFLSVCCPVEEAQIDTMVLNPQELVTEITQL